MLRIKRSYGVVFLGLVLTACLSGPEDGNAAGAAGSSCVTAGSSGSAGIGGTVGASASGGSASGGSAGSAAMAGASGAAGTSGTAGASGMAGSASGGSGGSSASGGFAGSAGSSSDPCAGVMVGTSCSNWGQCAHCGNLYCQEAIWTPEASSTCSSGWTGGSGGSAGSASGGSGGAGTSGSAGTSTAGSGGSSASGGSGTAGSAGSAGGSTGGAAGSSGSAGTAGNAGTANAGSSGSSASGGSAGIGGSSASGGSAGAAGSSGNPCQGKMCGMGQTCVVQSGQAFCTDGSAGGTTTLRAYTFRHTLAPNQIGDISIYDRAMDGQGNILNRPTPIGLGLTEGEKKYVWGFAGDSYPTTCSDSGVHEVSCQVHFPSGAIVQLSSNLMFPNMGPTWSCPASYGATMVFDANSDPVQLAMVYPPDQIAGGGYCVFQFVVPLSVLGARHASLRGLSRFSARGFFVS